MVKRNFKASHALSDYHGETEKSHQHDWLLEVTLESHSLDKSGCAIDFRNIDDALDKTVGTLKNKAIESTEAFKNLSPSAENIAKYISDSLKPLCKEQNSKIISVSVWEDSSHGASYLE